VIAQCIECNGQQGQRTLEKYRVYPIARTSNVLGKDKLLAIGGKFFFMTKPFYAGNGGPANSTLGPEILASIY
jgi:hypothetical protein